MPRSYHPASGLSTNKFYPDPDPAAQFNKYDVPRLRSIHRRNAKKKEEEKRREEAVQGVRGVGL
jgi:hypothetical protein